MPARRLASCKRQSIYLNQDRLSVSVARVRLGACALFSGVYPALYAPPVGTPRALRREGNSTPALEMLGGFPKHVNSAMALNPLNCLQGVN